MGFVPYSQTPQVLLAVAFLTWQSARSWRRAPPRCALSDEGAINISLYKLLLDAATAMGQIALLIQPFLTASSQARRKLEPDQKRKALRCVQTLYITVISIAIAGEQKEGRLKLFLFPEHHMAVTHPFPFL